MLQKEILSDIHKGHQGVTECCARARSVWWPGLSRGIKSFVNRCNVRVKYRINPTQPFLQSTLSHCPWQKVACDLFYFNNCVYLLLIDYCLPSVELALLNCGSIINDKIPHLKSLFAKFGIPEKITSNEGPQFLFFALKFCSTLWILLYFK